MSQEVFQPQVLFDATVSFNSAKVHQIIYDYFPLSSEVLGECLLLLAQKICQRYAWPENIPDVNILSQKGFDIIYILLDAGADVDKRDESGNTSLFYSAAYENNQLCDVLLQCGADMWANTEHGITVFDYVSEKCSSVAVTDTFNKFYPGLWKAVECENIYQVRQLINYWCRTNLQKNGLTLKDIALQTGNEEIINLILGICESMDLVYHIFAKNTEAVKKMLEAGKKKLRLNLRKMSDHGAPILYYLIQSRDVPTIELFIKYDCQIYTIMQDEMGNDMPVLFSALKEDTPVSVMEALLPKSKLQIEDILYKILYKGMTVLEVAMESRVSSEIFKLLIDRGGPLLLCDRNEFNETVYDVALSLNDHQYIKAIDECIYEWIQDPLQYSGRRIKLALLGWKFETTLYMENEDDNENIKEFFTTLNLLQDYIQEMSLAIESGDVLKFEELKNIIYNSNLCDVNMLWHARVVGDGMPLLHRAVLFNCPEIVEMILDDKPPKESIDNLFDQHHRIALHYAFAFSSTKKVQKLLLNCGCSEHVLDKMNKEPLDFKDKQDSPAITKLINRLKHKNYSECELDPWNSTVVFNDTGESTFYCDEGCSCNSEHVQYFCDSNGDLEENDAGYDSQTNKYEDESDETVSEEEEPHFRCLIS